VAGLMALVFAVGAVISIAIGLKGRSNAQSQRLRLQQCVPATGLVVEFERIPEVGAFPVVEFVDATGERHRTRTRTNRRWTWPQVGDWVSLHFDPEDPDWISVEGMRTPAAQTLMLSWCFIVFGVFCAGNAVFLAVMAAVSS